MRPNVKDDVGKKKIDHPKDIMHKNGHRNYSQKDEEHFSEARVEGLTCACCIYHARQQHDGKSHENRDNYKKYHIF